MPKFNTYSANSTAAGTALAGSGQLRLAPDLDLPSSVVNTQGFESVTFDPSGSLTEALGLSGKFAIYALTLEGLPTAEIVTVKLTVDGVIIWNDVGFTPTNQEINLYGQAKASTSLAPLTAFICKS